jgi:hypothetical protein
LLKRGIQLLVLFALCFREGLKQKGTPSSLDRADFWYFAAEK